MEIYLRREKRGRSGGGEGGGWVGMIISVCCFWQFDFETLLRREREREMEIQKSLGQQSGRSLAHFM